MNFSSSELIINSDGSVYHLGLRPGDVAQTIITVGDPDRVPMVSKYFDEIYLKVNKREIVTHTGRLGHKDITVISTGMGTDNIDIVLNELDAVINIDLETRKIKDELTHLDIIRLGTSGCIQADIPLESILATEYAIGYDGLLGFYDMPKPPYPEIPLPCLGEIKGHIVPGSQKLINLLAKDYIKGVTYTAAGFYAPQGRLLRAKSTQSDLIRQLQKIHLPDNRKITNIEMETAGLYGLGNSLGHDVLSISVLLANRVNGKFSQNPEAAIVKMIEDCLEKIEGM